MIKKIRIITALLLPLCLVILCSCRAGVKSYSSFAMGSVLTVKLYTNGEKAEELYDEINAAIQTADESISATKTGSDIEKINSVGDAQVSQFTIKAVEDCVMLCNTLNRLVDITMGSVTELWGFSSDSPSVPDEDALAEALSLVNIEGVLVDEDNMRISVEKGQRLDLGAFGKGIALDEAYYVLRNTEVPALVTLGGTVMIYGDKERTVGIRNPDGGENDCAATVKLTPGAGKALFVSTSGDYEKCFTENSVTYHHILNPSDGMPVDTGLRSVTVIASAGINADALSTYCFINGLNEDTLKMLKNFSASAVFIKSDGEIYITDDISDAVEILK